MNSRFSSRVHRRRVVARGGVALCVLLVVTMLSACSRSSDVGRTGGDTATSLQVGDENVVTVRRGRVESGPTLSGTLVPEKSATVRAQMTASITALFADVGTRVTAGMVLARLDDRTLHEALRSSRSTARSAQLSAENAKRELARQERLLAIEGVAQKDVDTARSTYETAMANVADAQSSVSSAEQALDRARVTAPFAGVVSERAVSLGDVVQSGSTMFVVVDPGTMRLEGTVPAEALTRLKVGAEVLFSVRGYGDQTFAGRITRISPSAESATRQVSVFASLANRSATLVAGLFASGRVTTTAADGLIIPIAALDSREQTPIVIRLSDGVAERVAVQLGLRDELAQEVLVTSGLGEGDILLTGSAQQVTAGTRIALARTAASPR